MTGPDTLSPRALNRALLARQGLIERTTWTPLETVERLVGLQAQDPKAPYYGLWSRIEGFDPEALSQLLLDRAVVRVALMRSTIHLVSARDALALRPLLQEQIERATATSWGARIASVDRTALAAAGRALVEAEPRTFAQLGALLAERWPDADPPALAQNVRALVALVQVPPRGLWGRGGAAAHTSAEAWLAGVGGAVEPAASAETAVRRYLAAFGPATVQDVQKWSGLTRLAPVVEGLRSELVSFSDGAGRELFDLPDAPRPDPDTPIALRLVAPFDNVLLAHADTTRILPAEHKGRVMTQNGLVSGTVLIDGFVQAGWKVQVGRRAATLAVTPYGRIPKRAEAALRREGERLLAFAAPEATERAVVLSGG